MGQAGGTPGACARTSPKFTEGARRQPLAALVAATSQHTRLGQGDSLGHLNKARPGPGRRAPGLVGGLEHRRAGPGVPPQADRLVKPPEGPGEHCSSRRRTCPSPPTPPPPSLAQHTSQRDASQRGRRVKCPAAHAQHRTQAERVSSETTEPCRERVEQEGHVPPRVLQLRVSARSLSIMHLCDTLSRHPQQA